MAAEALGFGLLLSPQLIDKAIVALNGNESLRLAKLQVYIGLHSGGVGRTVRQSTPLIQFFLITAACKLCYTSEEIGTVMYEMIVASGLLLKYAVAASQLSRLVDCLAAHAETMVPVDLMHNVAVAVSAVCDSTSTYRRIDGKTLAETLVSVFEHLRDENVKVLSLAGSFGGVWLATLFIWLVPERTSLFVKKKLVMGTGESTLCIELDGEQHGLDKEKWKIQVWKFEGDPKSYVFEDEGNGRARQFFPIRQTKLFIRDTRLGKVNSDEVIIPMSLEKWQELSFVS